MADAYVTRMVRRERRRQSVAWIKARLANGWRTLRLMWCITRWTARAGVIVARGTARFAAGSKRRGGRV